MENKRQKTLKNQTAVVTGASSGKGQAIAIKLGASGANVLINYYRDEVGAGKIQKEIERYGGKCLVVQADVSKQEGAQQIFAEAKKPSEIYKF